MQQPRKPKSKTRVSRRPRRAVCSSAPLGRLESLFAAGYKRIACLDEVGRGALIGDVVVCAVLLEPTEMLLPGIKDSKTLTEARRTEAYERIVSRYDCRVAHHTAKAIDELNILQATMDAMLAALLAFHILPDYVLIDGSYISVAIRNAFPDR